VGLTRALLRAGAARPHVLLAAVPGGTAVRLAAEAELRRRGWPAALSPAGADVLLFSRGGNNVVDNPMALWIKDWDPALPPIDLINKPRYQTALALVRLDTKTQ